VLHQVSPRIVDDYRMGYAGLGEFPGCQPGTLIPRAGFIDPDMQGNTPTPGLIYRSRGRTVAYAGQPAGIAMGEHIDGAPFLFIYLFDKVHSPLADPAAALDIFRFDLPSGAQSRGGSLYRVIHRLQPVQLTLHRPGQVDGSRPGGQQ